MGRFCSKCLIASRTKHELIGSCAARRFFCPVCTRAVAPAECAKVLVARDPQTTGSNRIRPVTLLILYILEVETQGDERYFL